MTTTLVAALKPGVGCCLRKAVDFVVRHPDGRQELIQVCWAIRDPETLRREQEALEEAKAELGLAGRILTVESHLAGTGRSTGMLSSVAFTSFMS